MMKRLLCLLAAFMLLASLLAVPVHAENFSDFSDNTVANNIDSTVGFLGDTLRTSKKLLNGEITIPDAVGEISSSAASHGIDIASSTIGDIVSGDYSMMSPSDAAKYIVNAVRNELKNSGADISNFPVGGNGYWTVGHKGNECKISTINFPNVASMNEAGFNHSCSYYNNPHSVIAIYLPDGTLYDFFYNNCSTGRPSDQGTLENYDIKNIIYLHCDSSHDYYQCYFTISYYDDGVLLTEDASSGLWLPPYHYNSSDPLPDPELVTETPDVDGLTDDELLKYIDNIIDNLNKTYPDLSTLEGKLQEIINLLNKTKDGGCSCDELAAAIRELISKLDNTGTDTELNNTLKELTKILENNQDLSSVIAKLEELQKELLKAYALDYSENDIKSVISKYNEFSDYLIDKKFAFVGSLTSIINTAVNSYKSSGENSTFTVTFNGSSHTIDLAGAFSSSQLDIFRYMIAAFIYVQFAFSVYRRIPGYINNGGDK